MIERILMSVLAVVVSVSSKQARGSSGGKQQSISQFTYAPG